MNSRHLTIILAALRHFQGQLPSINAAIECFFPQCDDVPSADEIDTLCESLNCGGGFQPPSPALHDKLSALLEDPARDLYAETIFTLTADYLAALAPHMASPTPSHLAELHTAHATLTRVLKNGDSGDETILDAAADLRDAVTLCLPHFPACRTAAAEGDKHTPGEWTAYPPGQAEDPSIHWEIWDEFGHTATVYGEGPEAEANARLMAAAPKLRDALDHLAPPPPACHAPTGESELIHWLPTTQGPPDEDIMLLIHCAEGTTGEAYLDSGEWQWSGMAGMVKTPVTHYAELPIGPGESPACHAPTEEDEDPDDQAIRDLATDQHCSDLIQIYPDAKLSHGDDNGCYVEAWVWADFTGTRFDKEAACTECGTPTDDGEGYDGLCGNCADKNESNEEPHGLECTVCTDDSCAWCRAEKSIV